MFYTSLGWFNGFNPDSWVMYLMYALIVVFISAEAIFYLVKSVKKAKQIGMDMTKIKKVIKTSASFSVLPQSVSVSALLRSSDRWELPSPQSGFRSSARCNTRRRWLTARQRQSPAAPTA